MQSPVAEKYGWESKDSEGSHNYLLPVVLEKLRELGPGGQLLDIGTGNGACLPAWHKAGFKVSAIEPDVDGFTFASENSRDSDIRLLGVGDTVPTEWKSRFDVAISLEVVEHLFNPKELTSFAYEALKPGGMFIVSTPYHGYLKNVALALANKWDYHHHPLRLGGHVKFWSAATLRELLEQRGFRFAEFHGTGRLPLLWKSMIIVARKP